MKKAFNLMDYLMSSGSRISKIREWQKAQGVYVPTFLVADIATRCNLNCPGCYKRWIQVDSSERLLSVNEWDSIFRQAEQLGVRFIFFTGGEPFLNKKVLERAGCYSNIWFGVFTSGTLLDEENLKFLSDHQNLVPVLCLESCSDIDLARMGRGSLLYGSLMRTMESLAAKDLIYGVSVGLTKGNRARVSQQSFLRELYRRKCNAVVYIEYEPDEVNKNHLLLSLEERNVFEQELADRQNEFDEMLLSSFNRDGKVVYKLRTEGEPMVHITASGLMKPRWNKQIEGINIREHTLKNILSQPMFEGIGREVWTEEDTELKESV